MAAADLNIKLKEVAASGSRTEPAYLYPVTKLGNVKLADGTALAEFAGASATVDAKAGIVPALAKGNQAKVLSGTGWKTLTASDVGASASGHKHSGADITSGSIDAARLPTATTSALGVAKFSSTHFSVTSGQVSLNGTYAHTVTTDDPGGDEVVTAIDNKPIAADSATHDSAGNVISTTYSKTTHTHNYAGSSSAGGAATSAAKLNTNAGAATTPVYFSNGVPVACSYSLPNLTYETV